MSPLYTAFQLNGLVALNMTDRELGTTALATVMIEIVEGDPVHVPLVKRSYVTVPPAVTEAPDSVAVSYIEPPTVIVVAERLVVMLGPFRVTVRSSHALVAALLLVSPLYAAFQLYGPAVLNV
jgi:hypothetical protein